MIEINTRATLKQFGYSGLYLPPHSNKPVLYNCTNCQQTILSEHPQAVRQLFRFVKKDAPSMAELLAL